MKKLLKEPICPECGIELQPYVDDEMSCSCHICAPCSKCSDERMMCPECGDIFYPDDFEPSPLEKLASKIAETLPKKKHLTIDEICEKVKSEKDGVYVVMKSDVSGWVEYTLYMRKELFDKHPKYEIGWLGKYVNRPNGFSKYDMVKIKRQYERNGVVVTVLSYCVD